MIAVFPTRRICDLQTIDKTMPQLLAGFRNPNLPQDQLVYAHDIEAPPEWHENLARVLPDAFLFQGPEDAMRFLTEDGAAPETTMAYVGIENTFTPTHIDSSSSLGANLMLHTEAPILPRPSLTTHSVWHLTSTGDADAVSAHLRAEGRPVELEEYIASADQLLLAGRPIYVVHQGIGDLVLIPSGSCHQVENVGGVSVKLSWSRLPLSALHLAYSSLVTHQRIGRPDYRIKLIIERAIRHIITTPDRSPERALLPTLADYFERILASELPASKTVRIMPLNQRENHVFSCDWCGTDIYLSGFCCKNRDCVDSDADTDFFVCPMCYVEGRICQCGDMTPYTFRLRTEVIRVLNDARLALKQPETKERDILATGHLATFRAAVSLNQIKSRLTPSETLNRRQNHISYDGVPQCACNKSYMELLRYDGVHVIDIVNNAQFASDRCDGLHRPQADGQRKLLVQVAQEVRHRLGPIAASARLGMYDAPDTDVPKRSILSQPVTSAGRAPSPHPSLQEDESMHIDIDEEPLDTSSADSSLRALHRCPLSAAPSLGDVGEPMEVDGKETSPVPESILPLFVAFSAPTTTAHPTGGDVTAPTGGVFVSDESPADPAPSSSTPGHSQPAVLASTVTSLLVQKPASSKSHLPARLLSFTTHEVGSAVLRGAVVPQEAAGAAESPASLLTNQPLRALGIAQAFQPTPQMLPKWIELENADKIVASGVWFSLQMPLSSKDSEENPFQWFLHDVGTRGLLGVRWQMCEGRPFIVWVFKCPVRRDATALWLTSQGFPVDSAEAANPNYSVYNWVVEPWFLELVYGAACLTPSRRRELIAVGPAHKTAAPGVLNRWVQSEITTPAERNLRICRALGKKDQEVLDKGRFPFEAVDGPAASSWVVTFPHSWLDNQPLPECFHAQRVRMVLSSANAHLGKSRRSAFRENLAPAGATSPASDALQNIGRAARTAGQRTDTSATKQEYFGRTGHGEWQVAFWRDADGKPALSDKGGEASQLIC